MKDLKTLEQKLEAEKKDLEEELSHLGVKKGASDWIATPEEAPQVIADKNEMADRLEDFEQTRSTEDTIEARLQNVNDALQKIKDGTYGTCEECGKEIEDKRLAANPAAKTCIEHTK